MGWESWKDTQCGAQKKSNSPALKTSVDTEACFKPLNNWIFFLGKQEITTSETIQRRKEKIIGPLLYHEEYFTG